MSLKEFHDAIQKTTLDRHTGEQEWFYLNPPIKEFSVEVEGELINYGVWNSNEGDLMVIFKTPDNLYHFKYKMYYNKFLIKELFALLEKGE